MLTPIGRKVSLNAAVKMRQKRPRYKPSGNKGSQSCLIEQSSQVHSAESNIDPSVMMSPAVPLSKSFNTTSFLDSFL